MSYVDLSIKDLKRILSIMSDYFGEKEMTEEDKDIRNKLEVMFKAELEWEDGEITL